MTKLQFESNKQYKLTLPKALVEAMGWKKGDELEFRLYDGKVMLRKSANIHKQGKGD